MRKSESIILETCDLCKSEFLHIEMHTTNQGRVCGECFHDNYERCFECGETFFIHDEMFLGMCLDCASYFEAMERRRGA